MTDEADMHRSHSYRLEDLDSSAELGRLRAQVEQLAGPELELLRRLGILSAKRFVDVGCGPGFFAEKLRSAVDGAEVIGVDVDAAMVELATRRTAGTEGLSFRLGTGQRLPLDDDSVDVAYARFLFQHLSHPGDVLAEMKRVVKPGGVVVVGDTDDGGLLVYPAPEGFGSFLEASARAQEARGGDRHIGRKLKGLFVAGGFEDVRAHAQTLTSEEIGAKTLVAIAVGFKAGVLGPPFATVEDVTRVTQELDHLTHRPDFFGHAIGYLAWGRVP